MHKCFKKVRCRLKKKNTTETMKQKHMKLRKDLLLYVKSTKCKLSKTIANSKLTEVENNLANLTAEMHSDTIKKHIKEVENNAGNFCQLKLWKLKSKIFGQTEETPTAKKDEEGNMITSSAALKKLYSEEYAKRLSQRKMNPEFEDVGKLKQKLWEVRMKTLNERKTNNWTMEDLEKSLTMLKNNKCSDPNGFVNEVFKEGCGGQDLKESLLKMYNDIKREKVFPDFVCLSNITSIYKKKGSRHEIENERGIFIISVFKKVLENLVFNDLHEDIDNNMSQSNIGA